MTGATSYLASAAVGGLLVVTMPAIASAQPGAISTASPVARPSSAAPGSLSGVVEDERGEPMANVVVSALGATTMIAITDRNGRYEFGTLTPGPYLVRAHQAGYLAPRARVIQVPASAGTRLPIALKRDDGAAPVLAAGLVPGDLGGVVDAPSAPASDTGSNADDHSDTAWRIRHARRSVLKDVTLPGDLADAGRPPVSGPKAERSHGFANLFADAPISGQVNLLTSGSFDTPQQLFSPDAGARNTANVRLAGPAHGDADWTVAGALTQADISSWVVAGAYSVRAPARNRYDAGISYSTQRYDGGNPLALRDVTDGSRNVGIAYGYDSLAVTSNATVAFGAEYARYDYLTHRGLFSPRVELTLTPSAVTRITASASRRSVAPGAEEFQVPTDAGIWLPPQRTFSPLDTTAGFRAERTLNTAVGLERDFGASTLVVHAFRQQVSDPLVTVFGADVPGQPAADVGHYLVGNAADVSATGASAEFRAVIANCVHGSLQYSLARGEILRSGSSYLMLLAPVAALPNHDVIQDVTARFETQLPETATRVMVLYRVSNGFMPAAGSPTGRPGVDSRFDVQVRQSLPFMNFSNARWEMLLAVRNFYRENGGDQSLYDELFVVRPPKRVVGGVTLHF
jgi:hypothetical protein